MSLQCRYGLKRSKYENLRRTSVCSILMTQLSFHSQPLISPKRFWDVFLKIRCCLGNNSEWEDAHHIKKLVTYPLIQSIILLLSRSNSSQLHV